jgi:hypothetical protein
MTRVKALSSKHLAYKINENDHSPPHIHVEGLGASVRINLLTLDLLTLEIMDSETDFSVSTLKKIMVKVGENRIFLLDKWEEIHGH